jgi:hypothetical protein
MATTKKKNNVNNSKAPGCCGGKCHTKPAKQTKTKKSAPVEIVKPKTIWDKILTFLKLR